MYFIRSVFATLGANLFRISLFGLPFVVGLTIILMTPSYLTKALEQSNTYGNIAPLITNQITSAQEGQANVLAGSDTRAAVNQVFAPSAMQKTLEQYLADFYAWLNNQTGATPSLDTAALQQQMLDVLVAKTAERAKTLPPCTPEQMQQINPQQSLLEATCLPPGTDVAQAAELLRSDAAAKTNFLAFTENSAGTSGEASGPMKIIATGYGIMRWAPWLMGLFVLLMAGLCVLASLDRRRALRIIGLSFISIGVLVVVFAVAITLLLSRLPVVGLDVANLHLTPYVNKIVGELAYDYSKIVGIVGIVYIVIGLGMTLVMRLTKPHAPPVETGQQPAPAPQPQPTPQINNVYPAAAQDPGQPVAPAPAQQANAQPQNNSQTPYPPQPPSKF